MMNIDGWEYYNHAALPTTAPHERVNMEPIDNGSIWKIGNGKAFLARWTTDFDCPKETNWWYLICEKPYGLDSLGKSTRKRIRKAEEVYRVERIDPRLYAEDLWRVYNEAIARYQKFDNKSSKSDFINGCMNAQSNCDYWGGFDKKTGRLYGWKKCVRNSNYIDFTVSKYSVDRLDSGISYVLNHATLDYYLNDDNILYVSNGERSIYHMTNVQEYYQEHFRFRRANCVLHVKYRFPLNYLVNVVFPFRNMLRWDNMLCHKARSLLKMEEIARSSKK